MTTTNANTTPVVCMVSLRVGQTTFCTSRHESRPKAIRRLPDSDVKNVITASASWLPADARTALAGARPGARTATGRRARRAHRVDQFRVKVGEKVWQLADQLCRRHGYLLYTAPSGDGVALVIERILASQ